MNMPDESARGLSELMDYFYRQEEEWERLHSLGAPKIGIFFVIDHRVYLDGEFKDLVKPGLDGIRQERTFESLWRSLLKYKILRGGLYHYPRGRIVFNDSLLKFFVYADVCFLDSENRSLLNQVLIELNLDHSQVSVFPSLDYKCARCHHDYGFREVEVEIVQGRDVEAGTTDTD